MQKENPPPAWSLPERVSRLERSLCFYQLINSFCIISLLLTVSRLRQLIFGCIEIDDLTIAILKQIVDLL